MLAPTPGPLLVQRLAAPLRLSQPAVPEQFCGARPLRTAAAVTTAAAGLKVIARDRRRRFCCARVALRAGGAQVTDKPEVDVKAEAKEEPVDWGQKVADLQKSFGLDFLADGVLSAHRDRRQRAKEKADEVGPLTAAAASAALQQAAQAGSTEAANRATEGLLRGLEAGIATRPSIEEALQTPGGLSGRWQVTFCEGLAPLQRLPLVPKQCIWMNVGDGSDGKAPVLSVHSGLQLPFGWYIWTSAAGDVEEMKVESSTSSTDGKPAVIRLNRFWIDVGPSPRPDIGDICGGLIASPAAAYAALWLTPLLLELGLIKWLSERFGFEKVFEVEVPNSGGKKLVGSLELYLTCWCLVFFPHSLSTCPVHLLDTSAGLCVYDIPILSAVGELPIHPGGNAGTFVARRLRANESPETMFA